MEKDKKEREQLVERLNLALNRIASPGGERIDRDEGGSDEEKEFRSPRREAVVVEPLILDRDDSPSIARREEPRPASAGPGAGGRRFQSPGAGREREREDVGHQARRPSPSFGLPAANAYTTGRPPSGMGGSRPGSALGGGSTSSGAGHSSGASATSSSAAASAAAAKRTSNYTTEPASTYECSHEADDSDRASEAFGEMSGSASVALGEDASTLSLAGQWRGQGAGQIRRPSSPDSGMTSAHGSVFEMRTGLGRPTLTQFDRDPFGPVPGAGAAASSMAIPARRVVAISREQDPYSDPYERGAVLSRGMGASLGFGDPSLELGDDSEENTPRLATIPEVSTPILSTPRFSGVAGRGADTSRSGAYGPTARGGYDVRVDPYANDPYMNSDRATITPIALTPMSTGAGHPQGPPSPVPGQDGTGDGHISNESVLDLARELHEIRTEFAHAQGYSSEAHQRIARLSAKLKLLKETHAANLASLRKEYEQKLKAAREREEELRGSLGEKCDNAENSRDRAEREVELTLAQLQDAQCRMREFEIAKIAAEKTLAAAEESAKLQIEKQRQQIAQVSEEHQKLLAELRLKNEALREELHTLRKQLQRRTAEAMQFERDRRMSEAPSVNDVSTTEFDSLRAEKEALERQLDRVSEAHLQEFDALQQKHQRLIAEAVAMRETNGSLRTDLQRLQIEHAKLEHEMRNHELAKLSRANISVGVQVAIRAAGSARHVLIQTDVTGDIVGGPNNYKDGSNKGREDKMNAAVGQDMGMNMDSLSPGSSKEKDKEREREREREKEREREREKSSVDERQLRELQEKLTAAERARVSLVSEMHEKLAAREEDWMRRQHELELKLITMQGEKEREIQSKQLQFEFERNQWLLSRSELEARAERERRERELNVRSNDASRSDIEARMIRAERELESTRTDLAQALEKLDSVRNDAAQLQEVNMRLEERMKAATTERENSVAAAAAASSNSAGDPHTQRLQRDCDELTRQLRETKSQLRQAREQIERRSGNAAGTDGTEQDEGRDYMPSSSRGGDREKLVELKRRLERKERESEKMRTRLDEMESKYARSQELVVQLSSELERDRSRNPNELPTPIDQQRRSAARAAAQGSLASQVQSLLSKLSQRDAELSTLRKSKGLGLGNAQTQQQADEEVVELGNRVQILEQKLRDRHGRISVLERQLIEKDVAIDRLRSTQRESPSTSAAVASELSELRRQLDARTRDSERYRARADDLEEQLARSQQLVQKLLRMIENARHSSNSRQYQNSANESSIEGGAIAEGSMDADMKRLLAEAADAGSVEDSNEQSARYNLPRGLHMGILSPVGEVSNESRSESRGPTNAPEWGSMRLEFEEAINTPEQGDTARETEPDTETDRGLEQVNG